MWNDANKDILDIFDKVKEKETLPLYCPVCGKMEAHIYMYRFKKNNRGSIWTWCSACKASAHERIMLPIWWKNSEVLDENLLGVHPDMLEEKKIFVDKYVNMLIKGEYVDKTIEQNMIKEN